MNKDEAPASPKDAALRLALEALEIYVKGYADRHKSLYPTIIAIKQALEEKPCVSPEPEPVAWVDLLKEAQKIVESKPVWKRFIDGTPLANDIACWMADFAQQHTSPPKREWQGLTDDERSYYLQTASNIGWWKASEIIEAKLKAKNGFPQTEKNT